MVGKSVRMLPAVLVAAVLFGGAGVASADVAGGSLSGPSGGFAIAPHNGEVTLYHVGTAGGGLAQPNPNVDAGGGTWSYGSGLNGVFKGCYSNYLHRTVRHSSTASIGADTRKAFANANLWSYANATAGVNYTCYTYWSNRV